MQKVCVLLLLAGCVLSDKYDTTYNVSDKRLAPSGNMPVIGLGTWRAKGKDVETALETALDAGYRHIDTAFSYGNEDIIGKVLRKRFDSGELKREDIFITTKLPHQGGRAASVKKYLDKSLEALQLKFIDLYLVHKPFSIEERSDGKVVFDTKADLVGIWKEMENQVDAGKARAIGVSNFNISQIQRILVNARIKPTNLQVELHAYMQQKPLVEFCINNGITVTAYSPLGSPGLGKTIKKPGTNETLPNILNNPIISAIALKHTKTEAQIILRHAIQKGLIVIPKSTHAERVRQNLDVFSFKLEEEDMKILDGLDLGDKGRLIYFDGFETHPEYPFKKY